MMTNGKPRVVVLGGNFAGLASAQKIREYAGDAVDITVIDRNPYLLFIPNIPGETFENRDPAASLRMDTYKAWQEARVDFIQGEVRGINPDTRVVEFTPKEREGSAYQTIIYDYLVVAFGCRLAYDRIPGFAEHGHASPTRIMRTDFVAPCSTAVIKADPSPWARPASTRGRRSRTSSRWPMPPAKGRRSRSCCRWRLGSKINGFGGPDKITVFTPGHMIAEDAGEEVVNTLLGIASKMGFHYRNNVVDITEVTAEGVRFANGEGLEAELKILLPDWVPHAFMKGLPLCDEEGFVVTDMLMRNPKYPEVLACGDAAAVTVPKLGAIGHQESEIVGKQIARDLGRISAESAAEPLKAAGLLHRRHGR